MLKKRRAVDETTDYARCSLSNSFFSEVKLAVKSNLDRCQHLLNVSWKVSKLDKAKSEATVSRSQGSIGLLGKSLKRTRRDWPTPDSNPRDKSEVNGKIGYSRKLIIRVWG